MAILVLCLWELYYDYLNSLPYHQLTPETYWNIRQGPCTSMLQAEKT